MNAFLSDYMNARLRSRPMVAGPCSDTINVTPPAPRAGNVTFT